MKGIIKMTGIEIIEGASGIIKIYNNNILTIRNPSYDLDSAQELLNNFYDINDKKNLSHGFDWTHSTISLLYWNLFYNYIKYQDILEEIGGEKIKKISKGNLKRLMYLTNQLTGKIYIFEYLKEVIKLVLNFFIIIRNIIFVNTSNKIIFINGSFNDFRGQQIIGELKNNHDVIEMARLSPSEMIRHVFNKNVIFRIYPYSLRFCFKKKNNINIFMSANNYILDIKENNIRAFRDALFLFKNAKAIFCFDDCNENHPFIHASKSLNKKIFAIQHGLYTSKHVAYTMNGFTSVTWYDNLIVYSQFWKEVFSRINNIYPVKNILVGANKHRYNYDISVKFGSRTILVIYEYLSDNIEVGKYIKELIKLKWNVIVKLRPDDPVDFQIETYQLSTDIQNSVLWIQNDLSSHLIQTDAILGVYSTMLFDLLPYKIPTFRMSNAFKFCEDEFLLDFIGQLSFEELPILADKIEESRCYNSLHPINVKHFSSENKLIDIVNF